MKKQALIMIATLFAFMLLLPVGAYAADTAYAILYEDGTLVFQYGDTTDSIKTAVKTYEFDLNAVYSSNGQPAAPWYNERESVAVVNFADKISPISTAFLFFGCKNLTQIENIRNLDTANVKHMFGTFYDCSGLTTLDVSLFDTSNVTSMCGMFYGCSGLTALDVSDFDTSNAIYMRYMFYGCNGLKTLDLSHFDTSNAKYMCNAFQGCNNLKTIYVSDKFTTAFVNETGEYPGSQNMFLGCASLVGGAGTAYDENHTDKEYARIDAPDAPGYFTDKSTVYAITAAAPDTEAGTLSVMFFNPNAVTLTVSYFDANGKFLSAKLLSVKADAETASLGLSADAKSARVMLFDAAFRPLCQPFEVTIS